MLCSVPGLLLVLAPGDPVQPGVGEGPQGGEGRVVVAPLQGGARAVANLNISTNITYPHNGILYSHTRDTL